MKKRKEGLYMKYEYNLKPNLPAKVVNDRVSVRKEISYEISKSVVLSMSKSMSEMSYKLSKEVKRVFANE